MTFLIQALLALHLIAVAEAPIDLAHGKHMLSCAMIDNEHEDCEAFKSQ